MSTAKATTRKRCAAQPELAKSDNLNLDLSSDIKGIMSVLQQIREKAHKDGLKKNEETISRLNCDESRAVTFPLHILLKQLELNREFSLSLYSDYFVDDVIGYELENASKIKEKACVVAMDLRGHGKSTTENETDLSIETMCNDVQAVLKAMYIWRFASCNCASWPQALVGCIFFTGEHTSKKYSGYVHGAYLTGIDTANALLEEMGRQDIDKKRLVS